jgi:hypothetical protein
VHQKGLFKVENKMSQEMQILHRNTLSLQNAPC